MKSVCKNVEFMQNQAPNIVISWHRVHKHLVKPGNNPNNYRAAKKSNKNYRNAFDKKNHKMCEKIGRAKIFPIIGRIYGTVGLEKNARLKRNCTEWEESLVWFIPCTLHKIPHRLSKFSEEGIFDWTMGNGSVGRGPLDWTCRGRKCSK